MEKTQEKLKMTASVLAGGLSRRMGTNKALIPMDGETIIARAVRVLKGAFDEVNIIANDPLLYEGLDVRVYSDIIKEAGSLGGVYTALFHAKHDHVFVTACDMPFLDMAVVRKVASAIDAFDAAVPFIGGRLHPMHAVYSKRCLKTIEAMIKEGNLRITELFGRIKTQRLTEERFQGMDAERSVENVNTKEELERLLGSRR
ncbi:MAG: molybdenum cofactor guanylyltransferase [Deltaproteobacteria bacterium]|nr:molybdenum cofactor guanylyltransferase [Deltaproteobacteria bacterium]